LPAASLTAPVTLSTTLLALSPALLYAIRDRRSSVSARRWPAHMYTSRGAGAVTHYYAQLARNRSIPRASTPLKRDRHDTRMGGNEYVDMLGQVLRDAKMQVASYLEGSECVAPGTSTRDQAGLQLHWARIVTNFAHNFT
jgi:hypothetical protein